MSLCTTYLSIEALHHNFHAIETFTQKPICAVIKANAYGHGDIWVAKELEALGAYKFAVSSWYEARRLREGGITRPIILLVPASTRYMEELISNEIEMNCSSIEEIELIMQAARRIGKKARVHAKLNSTMHRLGAYKEEWLEMIARIEANNDYIELVGLASHSPGAPGERETDETWSEFLAETEAINAKRSEGQKLERHWQNSAGLMGMSDADFVRVGLALLLQAELLPVLTCTAPLMLQKRIKKGEAVGYGSTWVAEEDCTIGVVAAGYADGIPRQASGKLKLWIGDKPYPQVGSICMDMMMINLGDDSYERETEVLIFGDRPHQLKDIADAASTIPYELLCAMSRRVQRVPQEA